MTIDPIAIDTDVLVIGSGAAGMYAAIEAARNGAKVLLADRSLIGRGGATVMAQMTVACALGEETPDDLATSLRRHHRRRPRAVRRGAGAAALRGRAGLHPRAGSLGRRLGAQGRPHHRDHGAGPRPAALRLCGFHQHRAGGVEDLAHGDGAQSVDPQSRRFVHRRSRHQRRRSHRRRRLSSRHRRAGGDRRQGHGAGDRRPDAALSAQQRLGQYGRRRLRAGAARRRHADRHGIRAVLSDRALGAAPRRHGPDHVGSVPLQARRPPPQRPNGRVHLALRLRRRRQIRADPRSRHLRDHQGGRGRTRLAARRRVSFFRALLRGGAARGVRPGDRSVGRKPHRSHPHAGRGGADRALSHGRREGRREHGDRRARTLRRRRSRRRRQWRQSIVRQRHHRGIGIRPPRRAQRRRRGKAHGATQAQTARHRRNARSDPRRHESAATKQYRRDGRASASHHGRSCRSIPHRREAQHGAR